jgi:hypothetical protein
LKRRRKKKGGTNEVCFFGVSRLEKIGRSQIFYMAFFLCLLGASSFCFCSETSLLLLTLFEKKEDRYIYIPVPHFFCRYNFFLLRQMQEKEEKARMDWEEFHHLQKNFI